MDVAHEIIDVAPQESVEDRLNVIDLFCGAGGFSLGASAAGARVVLAVDSWPEAIRVHKYHHPTCQHVTEPLGGEIPLWVERIKKFECPGEGLHIHASPPCQNLSSSNHARVQREGLTLVFWTLDLFRALQEEGVKFSWSLEQVPAPAVTAIAKERGLPHRVINMERYGVPQTRRRLLIVSDGDMLDIPPVAPLLWGNVVTIPKEAKYITGSTICRKRLLEKHKVFLTQRKSVLVDATYTVTSRAGCLFLDGDLNEVGRLSVSDFIALQTFPPDHFAAVSPPLGTGNTLRLNANAIPPAFAKQAVVHWMKTRKAGPVSTV
jgi:site-specific DNA-cytosine methylase